MNKPPVPRLEKHRFSPNENSLRIMKEVKRLLPEIEDRFHEIYGVTFFGSRTIGTDKETSDLDMMVFYDGSDWERTEDRLNIELEEAENRALTDRDDHTLLDRVDAKVEEQREHYLSRNLFITDVHNRFVNTLEAFGVKFNEDHKREKKGVFVLDASPQKLTELFAQFKSSIDFYTRNGSQELKPHSSDIKREAFFRFMGILCLSTGSRIQEMRAQFFHIFEKDPKGDFYFQALIQYLEFFERTATTPKRQPLPTFKGYPRTLKEGRQYFLVAPFSP